jgi:DNA-binding protein H-NS
MATIKELQAQLAELQRQIAETTQREKADAIAQIKKIMEEQGLTMADIEGGGGKRGRPAGGGGAKGSKVAPKYRDPVSGKEWTGRGVAPNWIKDKNRDDFLIKS